jgi:hypothetical protein
MFLFHACCLLRYIRHSISGLSFTCCTVQSVQQIVRKVKPRLCNSYKPVHKKCPNSGNVPYVMCASRYKCVTMGPYSSFFYNDNKHFHCLTTPREGLVPPPPHLKVMAPLQGRLYSRPRKHPPLSVWNCARETRYTMKTSCKVRGAVLSLVANYRAVCLHSRRHSKKSSVASRNGFMFYLLELHISFKQFITLL